MKTTTQPAVTMEKLLDEFGTAAAATQQLLGSAASAGGERAAALGTTVEQSLGAAAERLTAMREQAIARTTAAAQATDQYVHRSPWQAVGIVAALAGFAGLLTGLLIRRHRADDEPSTDRGAECDVR